MLLLGGFCSLIDCCWHAPWWPAVSCLASSCSTASGWAVASIRRGSTSRHGRSSPISTHHGDLGKLIQYHLDSNDPKFHAEGAVIRSPGGHRAPIAERRRCLARQPVSTDRLSWPGMPTRYSARATFGDWVPTFSLSGEGILFALLFAIGIWLVFHALWWLLARGGRRLRGRPRAPESRMGPDAVSGEASDGAARRVKRLGRALIARVRYGR